MDSEEFYLVSDNDYLISIFQQELIFIKNNWIAPGRPTMSIMLTDKMLGSIGIRSSQSKRRTTKRNLFNFMMSLRSGICGGVRIRLGRLSEMINTSCIESLDFLANSEQENWHSILCSYRENIVTTNLSLDNAPLSGRSRSIKRGRSVRRMSGSGLGLNINSTGSDTAIAGSNEDELSPKKIESPVLVLSFGDPTNIKEATQILRKSSNIYDQIDLLQYLHSCHGPSYNVEGLGLLSNLIEEIYVIANRLCEWSILRQAAGLLKKVVNNLSINIAEFLIRKKPVTIGTRESSHTIDSPMTPRDLVNVIHRHCVSDIRYSCLVQEIITYLASYIRSHESLFSGMIRIRTHFIIVAMRDEISRMKGCDEVESVEHLMAVR
jgi:phosphorylase kinase alpha/beta subunit